MHLFDHDYFSTSGPSGHGLERVFPVIERLRREAAQQVPQRTCLLFDNGDLLQGTPLARQIASSGPDTPHAAAEILNAMEYDAFGVGNHDLDFELQVLERFATSFDGPVISSNLTLASQPEWLMPWALLPVEGLQIGILSVLPQPTKAWATVNSHVIEEIAPLAQTVAVTSRMLRAAGADLVVVLAHSGIGSEPGENALEDIARDGHVDVIVGGHTHKRFPGGDHSDLEGADMEAGTLFGIPLVMPGFAGACLGVIDLEIEVPDNGKAIVRTARARLEPASQTDVAPAPVMKPAVAPHNDTIARLDSVVGTAVCNLNTYFAQVSPGPLTGLLAAAQSEVIMKHVAGTSQESLPLLSAVCAMRVGGRAGPGNYTAIPAGAMLERHIVDLSTFENKVWAVELSGLELLAWLEKSAAAFETLDRSATDKGLLNRDVPSFDYDQIYGVSYEIDVTCAPRYLGRSQQAHPSNARIRNLRFKGQDVDAKDRFLMATTSYRAVGGGHFPGLPGKRSTIRTNVSSNEMLRTFLAQGGCGFGATPWSFSRESSGIRTWFETSPDAAGELDEIAHLDPGEPARQPDGFLRVPITL